MKRKMEKRNWKIGTAGREAGPVFSFSIFSFPFSPRNQLNEKEAN